VPACKSNWLLPPLYALNVEGKRSITVVTISSSIVSIIKESLRFVKTAIYFANVEYTPTYCCLQVILCKIFIKKLFLPLLQPRQLIEQQELQLVVGHEPTSCPRHWYSRDWLCLISTTIHHLCGFYQRRTALLY